MTADYDASAVIDRRYSALLAADPFPCTDGLTPTSLSAMRCKGLSGMLWLIMATGLAALEPKAVAILYNSADAGSKELAEFYAKARSIPAANLVGLDMPVQEEISRAEYDKRIAAPLREEFNKRDWWSRRKSSNGVLVATRNQIRVLVTMRGVPLKIAQSPRADGKPHPDPQQQPFSGHDEASVDSELALLGVVERPLEGAQRSGYFRSEKPIAEAGMPEFMLTCRIDAASLATCKRMIEDAIAAEKSGLWGFHAVDIAKKFPQGDDWLEGIVKQNLKIGVPTLVDRFPATLPAHYPLRNAACYYGWYDWNLSGPMLDADFRFRQGAIAIHIHSFSAQQLRNPAQNWSAGLLEAGAAATIGNVYEPYLGLTHHLDVLHERLLAGHTWVEASWMAMPAISWQGITLGDPLYRPFAHLDGSGEVLDADREFRAIRAAMVQWGDNPAERATQLRQAAIRMKSGIFLEANAQESLEGGDAKRADALLVQAHGLYTEKADKLRVELQRVAIMRAAGNNDSTLLRLRELAESYQGFGAAKAVEAWIHELAPAP